MLTASTSRCKPDASDGSNHGGDSPFLQRDRTVFRRVQTRPRFANPLSRREAFAKSGRYHYVLHVLNDVAMSPLGDAAEIAAGIERVFGYSAGGRRGQSISPGPRVLLLRSDMCLATK